MHMMMMLWNEDDGRDESSEMDGGLGEMDGVRPLPGVCQAGSASFFVQRFGLREVVALVRSTRRCTNTLAVEVPKLVHLYLMWLEGQDAGEWRLLCTTVPEGINRGELLYFKGGTLSES